MQPEAVKLPKKLAKLTERLAVQSQWLKRQSSPMKDRSPRALPSPMASAVGSAMAGSFDDSDRAFVDSRYASSGLWPSVSPPKPYSYDARGKVARSQVDTALQRRNPPTADYHLPETRTKEDQNALELERAKQRDEELVRWSSRPDWKGFRAQPKIL